MTNKFTLPTFITQNTQLLERQQSSILSAAAVITGANIISSAAGLIRERVLISAFFDTPASRQSLEAFQVAFQIPDTLFQLLVLGALSAAFIPIFSRLAKKDPASAFAMTSVVMNIILLLFLAVSAVIFIFAEPLTRFRTGTGFTDDQVVIAAQLTRIMIGAQLLFAVSNFFSGMLQSYRRFIIPALAPILYNLGIILTVVFFHITLNIYAAGLGVAVGAFLHMACQLPLVKKIGYRHVWSLNLSLDGVKELFRLMPPRVATYAVTSLQDLLLAFLTTTVGNLSFFVMRLGLRLMTIPIRLFGVPIGQASLSFLSAESDESERTQFRHLVIQSFNQITFFALPASVLLLILRIPIVRLVFGARNLPWETTVATGRVVALIALSVVAQALVQLLIRSFHALKDTKTPFLISLLVSGLTVAGSAVFVYFTTFPLLGIAAVISFTAFIELGLFLIILNSKVGSLMTKSMYIPQLKMLFSGFLMAVFLYLPFRILDELVFDTSKTIELIALTITTSTIGLVVYLYFAALLEIQELDSITNFLFSMKKRKQPLPVSQEIVLESSANETNVS